MAGAATVNKGDKRRVSGPYTIERGLSLRDRISRRTGSSSDAPLSKGDSFKPHRAVKNPDNPLYAYLSGSKPSKQAMRSTQVARQSESAAGSRKNVETTSRENRHDHAAPRAREVSIRGSGSAANTFTIRGASSTSVSIKNLAPGTTQADVCTILAEQVGEVDDCVTFPVKGGISTTAEVRFGSRIAADKAIDILHGVLADNKRLDVSILVTPGNPSTDAVGYRHSSESAVRGRLSRESDMPDIPPESQPVDYGRERRPISSSDRHGEKQLHKTNLGNQQFDLYESREIRTDSRNTGHEPRGKMRALREPQRSYRH